MAFRDDLEATQRRVDALERELAEARRGLEGASAAGNESLRKQVGALTRERDALRAGVMEGWEARVRRSTGLAAVLLAVCLVVGGVAFWSWSATRDTETELATCERRRESCLRDLDAAAHDRDDALRDLSHLEDERSMELARSAPRPGRMGTFIRFRVDQRAPPAQVAVGDECFLLVGYDSPDPPGRRVCSATVVCGMPSTLVSGVAMACAMLDPSDRVAGNSPLSSVHGPGLDYVRATGEVNINGSSGAPGSIHGGVIYTTPITLP